MTDRQLFLWWFRWALVFMALAASPCLLAAGGVYYASQWLRLAINAPETPVLQKPIGPGFDSLPQRLWVVLKDPAPAADAPRPEKALLEHTRQKTFAACAAKVLFTLSALLGFLNAAALAGWIAIALRKTFPCS
jgi:hypothetical protein